ncbi:MAG: aspartate dehydrogenase [Candidatus Omnitrophica bacterium]|nr:aspartate dehydrogenase [Candidatus Omnitrophota bacterium]MDD5027071.1 aspartate dehydrogenase [Candidatus Omnitrophota bacterium]MDD5662090.1 aspartate dehydrogenase [Candidatus Omnitrophota bacterium]
MPKLKIGIVGCGAIGSSLAGVVVQEFSREAELCALFDVDSARAQGLSKALSGRANLAADNLKQLLRKSELIIEASSAKASWDIAKEALSAGKDVMIMSVGGIASRFAQLVTLAKNNRSKVYIPSGALCGIDGLKAAKAGRIKRITLTTTKNPGSFEGVKYVEARGINLKKIKRDIVLFSGRAGEAVRYFPQNINVAAVLSLAGIGVNKTRVRIIASPKVTRNIHEVRVESVAGNITTRTENVLHPDNPKTSYLAVLSAMAMLRQILDPVRIGT